MPIGRCNWCGQEAEWSVWTGACAECERKEPDIQARLYRDSRAGLIRPGSLAYQPKRREDYKKREKAP